MQWIELIGFFALVFAASAGISYFLTTVKIRRSLATPLPNGVLQIRSGTSMYRSHFVGENEVGWIISAPLARDSYVPIRVGEKLAAWLPTDQGLKQFQSEVLLRDSSNHQLTIQKPQSMSSVERRLSPRKVDFKNREILIEREAAFLVDLSEGGARVKTHYPAKKGERVRMDIPETAEVFGWILDSRNLGIQHEVRLRFETAVPQLMRDE